MIEDYHISQFNEMLQIYAGRDGQATVKETHELERMSRLDFHTFVLAKKNIFDKRNKKVE